MGTRRWKEEKEVMLVFIQGIVLGNGLEVWGRIRVKFSNPKKTIPKKWPLLV